MSVRGISGTPVKSKWSTCAQLWESRSFSHLWVGEWEVDILVMYVSLYLRCPLPSSLKGQCKPCWSLPLKTSNLFTAVSQKPRGCMHLLILSCFLSAYPQIVFSECWLLPFLLGLQQKVGRWGRECWRVTGGCWAFSATVSVFSAPPDVLVMPKQISLGRILTQGGGGWISRNNSLLMVGSWAAVD